MIRLKSLSLVAILALSSSVTRGQYPPCKDDGMGHTDCQIAPGMRDVTGKMYLDGQDYYESSVQSNITAPSCPNGKPAVLMGLGGMDLHFYCDNREIKPAPSSQLWQYVHPRKGDLKSWRIK